MMPEIIPVSVVCFNSLRSITLFYRKSIGVQGISTQSDEKTCTFGLADGIAISLSLKRPEEFVTELTVYISSVIDIEVGLTRLIVTNTSLLILLCCSYEQT